jgi:hypothetical protein
MKLCSQCSRTYPDDNLKYCLSDGTPLVSVFAALEEAAVIKPASSFQPPPQSARQSLNPVFAYLAIGLFALIAGGAIIAWIKSDPTNQTNISAQSKNETPLNASGIAAQNTALEKEPVVKRGIEVVEYSDPKPEPPSLTADAVRNVLMNWERAQENKNFASYQACYDSSFVGVKVIKSGSSETFDYSSWMRNRRRMITNAVNLDIDISNLRVRVEGDTATAEFDQYYRSLRYSDWGPKEIKMKTTPSGAKIVYEELKASHPL